MITSRRTGLACIGVACLVLTMSAGVLAVVAQGVSQPFTSEAFEAAQNAGKPILVETYATWCDVCARQAPILDKLREEPKYKNLVIFRVDFDTQKDIMRKFNARMQSMLIAFHGTKEVGRSIGETQPEWIDDLVQKTLGEGGS